MRSAEATVRLTCMSSAASLWLEHVTLVSGLAQVGSSLCDQHNGQHGAAGQTDWASGMPWHSKHQPYTQQPCTHMSAFERALSTYSSTRTSCWGATHLMDGLSCHKRSRWPMCRELHWTGSQQRRECAPKMAAHACAQSPPWSSGAASSVLSCPGARCTSSRRVLMT